MRGYHGDWLQEGRFQRNYLPSTLPPIVESSRTPEHARKGQGASVAKKDKVPLGSMMFAPLESRLDVLVFRACLAPSVYKARHLVIHGRVKVDGIKVLSQRFSPSQVPADHLEQENNPNLMLKPGQMFSVDPASIDMLQGASSSAAPAKSSESAATEAEESTEADEAAQETPTTSARPRPDAKQVLPFHLPDYAAPFIFIPPYLEVNFPTASAVYVRHPTAGPGFSEIPTPYEADGEVVRLAWEWYTKGKRRMERSSGRPGNDYRRRGSSSAHIVDMNDKKVA